MALNRSNLTLTPNWSATLASGSQTSAQSVSQALRQTYQDGTGQNQAQLPFALEGALTDGQTVSFDLAALLVQTDPGPVTVQLTSVRSLIIANLNADAGSVLGILDDPNCFKDWLGRSSLDAPDYTYYYGYSVGPLLVSVQANGWAGFNQPVSGFAVYAGNSVIKLGATTPGLLNYGIYILGTNT